MEGIVIGGTDNTCKHMQERECVLFHVLDFFLPLVL